MITKHQITFDVSLSVCCDPADSKCFCRSSSTLWLIFMTDYDLSASQPFGKDPTATMQVIAHFTHLSACLPVCLSNPPLSLSLSPSLSLSLSLSFYVFWPFLVHFRIGWKLFFGDKITVVVNLIRFIEFESHFKADTPVFKFFSYFRFG